MFGPGELVEGFEKKKLQVIKKNFQVTVVEKSYK